ncbi:7-dehydrocholesterol reductase-like isoform X1 [Daphnia pulex]|uniref:7-dehydrocholesterol reductase-like isoform X1 n=2 Tax=Daphnia pulex TaxID=6669 RepID=UPI001EDF6E1E|nr:7-dehydrocholesterol reductase-like isoform X1 [Daphnia pulex]XP_046455408.1 7-dehydrocholesterol reductase-like isoform X1 [Daphnia pulex]
MARRHSKKKTATPAPAPIEKKMRQHKQQHQQQQQQPATAAEKKSESQTTTWSRIKHFSNDVIAPFFLVFFTPAIQILAHLGNPAAPFQWDRLLGNSFSWTAVAVFFLWSLFFLLIPSRTFVGPPSPMGYKPEYADNGMLYYTATLFTYLGLHVIYPDLSLDIYDNMAYILGSLNIFALTLCTVLLFMGRNRPQTSEVLPRSPMLFEFYRGMELHPRLLGVDVKQWTNCRVGMMIWQIFIVAFLIAGGRQGISPGHVTNVLLQTIYIAKFFWWETGYFNTLDITLDRAGYYICWGCLVWVPAFYTYSSYYLVANRSHFSAQGAFVIGLLGLLGVVVNYWVDYEKQLFRETDGKCRLWGKPAKFLPTVDKKTKKPSTKLMLSGFWGVARHLNYTFELMAALMWCFPGYGHGIWPFLYFFFLIVLLVHRCYRDEDKCMDKYGPAWVEYCKRVPYRMIPYVF